MTPTTNQKLIDELTLLKEREGTEDGYDKTRRQNGILRLVRIHHDTIIAALRAMDALRLAQEKLQQSETPFYEGMKIINEALAASSDTSPKDVEQVNILDIGRRDPDDDGDNRNRGNEVEGD